MPITYIIILIIIAIFLLFFLYIEPMLAKNKIKNNNEHGSARFANFKEIRRDFKKESISNINKAGFPIWYSKDKDKRSIRVYNADSGEIIPFKFEKKFPILLILFFLLVYILPLNL